MFGSNGAAVCETPIGRGQAVVRPDTSTKKGLASLPPQNPMLPKQPGMEYLSERIKRAKQEQMLTMAVLPQFQRPMLHQNQQQRQQQMGTNMTHHQREHSPQTDSESEPRRNLTFLHKSIGNPQNCIVQRQIESNTAKMLVILQNGEQRLITFDIPNEDCTVQDLLEQANIPICPETSISLVKDETLQINYVVEAGPGTYSYSAEGSEQGDTVSNPSPEKQPISPDSSSSVFSPSEENSNSSMTQSEEARYVDGKLAVCPNCGISSIDFNRCQRCERTLPEDVKTVSTTMAHKPRKKKCLRLM